MPAISTVTFNAPAFTCPNCQVYSQQTWVVAFEQQRTGTVAPYAELHWAICLNCKQRTIWFRQRLVAPVLSSAPPPNPDMPKDVVTDFDEARDIAERSPRSAAGLLRLCIHRLCIQFGGTGANLNADIAELVSGGLSPEVQQALDAIRIVGNSQLHPDDDGIDLRANPEAISLLFTFVNLIVENQISLPRKAKEFYESLPEGSREAVRLRNDKALAKKTTSTLANLEAQDEGSQR